MTSMDANFRWFEGEKAQYRFVPYGWAFLLPLYGNPKATKITSYFNLHFVVDIYLATIHPLQVLGLKTATLQIARASQ